jgi:hypothetical protein
VTICVGLRPIRSDNGRVVPGEYRTPQDLG